MARSTSCPNLPGFRKLEGDDATKLWIVPSETEVRSISSKPFWALRKSLTCQVTDESYRLLRTGVPKRFCTDLTC